MMIVIRNEDYAGRRAVEAAYPEAARIVSVCGGWAVFETLADYETWRRQR